VGAPPLVAPPGFGWWQAPLLRIPGLAYLLAHELGRRLIYPGSLQAMQHQLRGALLQGRQQLLRAGGQRVKIATACGGAEVDGVIVDRRGNKGSFGNTQGEQLVLTIEPNGSFYEVGNTHPPLQVHKLYLRIPLCRGFPK